MAQYGYHYYKATYITHPIRDVKRWLRYLRTDILRFCKKKGLALAVKLLRVKQPTKEQHDALVRKFSCIQAHNNTFLHQVTQYQNNQGNKVFHVEDGIDELTAPSRN